MTFLTDVVKMGYSEDEVFAVLHESEQHRKRRQVLAKVTETVAAYRLREMKDLEAREKLATWRRMNGFDRPVDDENNWFHGPRLLPPTPEEFAVSLWSELNALRDAISMPEGDRFSPRAKQFVKKIEQCTVNSTDAIGQFTANMIDGEFATLRRLVKKRDREAAQVTVTPVDTVQCCSPRPQTPEPSSDVCVNLENNEGRMDPERDELEPPSAGTGLETPGQQCHPI